MDGARPITAADIDRVIRRQNRAFVSTQPPTDALLNLVAILGRSGAGIAVGMVVDGMIVTGAIGGSLAFAAALRDATADALGPAFASDAESTEEMLGSYERWIQQVEEQIEEEREVAEPYLDVASVDEIPVEDTIGYFSSFRERPYVELHDVSIQSGSREPIQVAHARVRVDRVSAWWPLKAQGVDVNYVWHYPDDDVD